MPTSAQATAPVPLEDPSYALLDRAAAQLTPRGMIHGQRPYTRLELARLTREMQAALDSLVQGDDPPAASRATYLRELLAALSRRYQAESALLPEAANAERAGAAARERAVSLDVIRLDGSLADSPFRGFDWNGMGGLENAQVNPLLDYRHGRELADGLTSGIELEPRLRLGARGVMYGSARVAYHDPRGVGGADVDVQLRTGALRGKLGSWALQAGRAQIRRGQGRHAGLLFSDNAPPLDMLYLQNEELFRLPWIFGAAGPARFSAFFADLGGDQNFPHAKLYGNWLTFRPARRLEVGGGFIVQDGGEGGPEQSVWRRIGDYLIFVDVLFQMRSDFQASNKIAGVDFRLAVPEAGATLYGEMYLDDFRVANWNHVKEMLWPDAGHIFGVQLARLDGVGRLSAWGEYQHTGIRIYRHYDYRSGVTRGRFLLGSGLGSDAQAVVGGLDLAASASGAISLEAGWERRSQDEWTAPTDPYFHFERVESHPKELRRRVQLAWDHRPLDRPIGWRVEAGAEQVERFDFQRARTETNAVLRLVLEWSPGR